MSTFVRINKNFTLGKEGNFWQLNPAMTLYSPYSKLYNSDESRDKDLSSRKMWSIFFLSDPDWEYNPFYNREFEDVKKMIEENYLPSIDWEDEVFNECLNAFPDDCLTPIAKALKDEMTSMLKRARKIVNYEYDLDDEDGRKGAKDVDMMRKGTPALIDAYDKLEAKFLADKTTIGARGGRKLAKAEKGNFW